MQELTGQFERPPRPQRLDQIVILAGQALKSFYGEEALEIPPENVHWVSREEFEAFHTGRPIKRTLINQALISVGAKDALKDPLTETSAYIHSYLTLPVQLYISSNILLDIHSDDIRIRTTREMEIIGVLLKYAIGQSKVPQVYYDEVLLKALEDELKRNRVQIPKSNPSVDKDQLNLLADNVDLLIHDDETREYVLEGAEVVCRVDNGGQMEDLVRTGKDFESDLMEYLGERAVAEFAKLLVTSYPPILQPGVAKTCQENLVQKSSQRIKNIRVQTFLKAIGLAGYKDTFWAHYNSEIPKLYAQAKKKKLKSPYPA